MACGQRDYQFWKSGNSPLCPRLSPLISVCLRWSRLLVRFVRETFALGCSSRDGNGYVNSSVSRRSSRSKCQPSHRTWKVRGWPGHLFLGTIAFSLFFFSFLSAREAVNVMVPSTPNNQQSPPSSATYFPLTYANAAVAFSCRWLCRRGRERVVCIKGAAVCILLNWLPNAC